MKSQAEFRSGFFCALHLIIHLLTSFSTYEVNNYSSLSCVFNKLHFTK
jgi:hypothetical protein